LVQPSDPSLFPSSSLPLRKASYQSPFVQDFSAKEQKVVRVHGENVNRRAADGRQAHKPGTAEADEFP
jgi:hypothetical protein